jgi:hypothetical protein
MKVINTLTDIEAILHCTTIVILKLNVVNLWRLITQKRFY